VTLLLGFVVTPIVLGFLGRDLYGFWVIVGSVIGYVGMVDFGITGSVGTLIAREQGSPESVNRIAANALAMHTTTGACALLLSIAAAVYAPDLLHVPDTQRDLISKLILLAGTGLALSFPARTLKAVFRGTQRIATLRFVEFVLTLFRTGLMLLLLFLGVGILALPWSTIASSLLSLLVFTTLACRRIPGFRIRVQDISREQSSRILSVSGWWFLGSLGALFIYQTDNIVLGRYLDSAAVTTYALTFRVAEMIRGQMFQLNLAIAPGVGDLVGRGDTLRLRSVFISGTRIVLFLGLSAAFLIMKLNRGFISLWVGSENYGGDLLTAVFAGTLVYLVFFHSAAVILTNLLDLRVLAGTRFLEGIFNLLLSLALVRRYGLVGVAGATLAAGLLTTGWFLPRRAGKLIGLSTLDLVKQLLAVVPFFVLGAAGFVAVPSYGDVGWWGLAWRGICLGGWLAVSGWWTLLPREEIGWRFRGVILGRNLASRKR